MTRAVEPVMPTDAPWPGWNQSLGRGAVGNALLSAVTGADAELRDQLRAVTRTPLRADVTAGLFTGAPAVAYLVHLLGHPEHDEHRRRLHHAIVHMTRLRLNWAHARIDRGALPELWEFDLINGLTGIGVYLHTVGDRCTLREVLAYLVRLVQPVVQDREPRPGWSTANSPADHPDPVWPHGHVNLGIAHGAAGPLALLATTALSGITVAGQAEAMNQVDCWFDQQLRGTPERPWWPGLLNPGTSTYLGPQRPSWCYGTPGIARTRQLVALALDDLPRRRRAEAALLSCVTDARQLALLDDHGLCHGWSGLALTAYRAAADAADSELTDRVPELIRHWHDSPQWTKGDGLLEGTTGTDLTRHTLDTPGAPRWDACLLITAPDEPKGRT